MRGSHPFLCDTMLSLALMFQSRAILPAVSGSSPLPTCIMPLHSAVATPNYALRFTWFWLQCRPLATNRSYPATKRVDLPTSSASRLAFPRPCCATFLFFFFKFFLLGYGYGGPKSRNKNFIFVVVVDTSASWLPARLSTLHNNYY